MAFDFAATKALVRRAVHDTFAVSAVYQDDTMPAPQPLRIRWHNKMSMHGDLESTGYSQIIDSVDRVIFDREELQLRGVEVVRGGKIIVTARGFDDAVLRVDSRDEMAGPLEEIWLVGKE